MTARNDVTGDAIKTGSSSDAYRDGWDLIFKKDFEEAFDQTIGSPQLTKEEQNEVYDQWRIDAENAKRLNDLTQED